MIFHTFPPFIGENTHILILGSFPSQESRKQGFYYMHPQNRFYRVLGALFEENFFDCSISEKQYLLNKHHIGLYDVIEACDIQGSADATIKNPVISPIRNYLKTYPIVRIYLNGQKAYSLFCKYFPDLKSIAKALPSTSSANASWTIDKLIQAWSVILENSSVNDDKKVE